MKEIERKKKDYEEFVSKYKPSRLFVNFAKYEKQQKCRLRRATYGYAKLKYLLHTMKFWNMQVQRISVYRSISKFVSGRIQDVILNENQEQMIRLILQLMQDKSLSDHRYLKMLRFTKPPMFDQTMND